MAKAEEITAGLTTYEHDRRKADSMFDQITSDPQILGGKPIVRGTRISVELILEWFASGATRDEIIQSYPQLSAEAVEDALSYAAAAVNHEVVLTSEVVA